MIYEKNRNAVVRCAPAELLVESSLGWWRCWLEAVEDEVEAEVDIGEASEVKPAGDDAMEGQQFWHIDCCAE